MSDQPTPPIRDAPAPFCGEPDPDNHRTPDFILRSSDGVDFHVHKEMLKLTSDFFDGMFTIPKANPDPDDLSRDGLTVLPMAEPNNFFRVLRVLKEMLENFAPVEAHPHRLFAIARLQAFPALARKAALHTLKFDVATPTVKFPEMRLLTWDTVQNLFDFHHACGAAAQSIIQGAVIPRSLEGGRNYCSSHYKAREHENPLFLVYDQGTKQLFVWWDPQAEHDKECGPSNWAGERIAGRSRSGTLNPVQWFRSHIECLSSQLRLHPSHHSVEQKVFDVAALNCKAIDACQVCSEKAIRDLATFALQLAVCIEESNRKLVLPTPASSELPLASPTSATDGPLDLAGTRHASIRKRVQAESAAASSSSSKRRKKLEDPLGVELYPDDFEKRYKKDHQRYLAQSVDS
ncbi:hypothetical protein B0H13DRAFT_2653396 [Mycena leptocephala]|nr:hypothetical protein B0H13DRAFT_2653396 [Mycena leptocephala]